MSKEIRNGKETIFFVLMKMKLSPLMKTSEGTSTNIFIGPAIGSLRLRQGERLRAKKNNFFNWKDFLSCLAKKKKKRNFPDFFIRFPFSRLSRKEKHDAREEERKKIPFLSAFFSFALRSIKARRRERFLCYSTTMCEHVDAERLQNDLRYRYEYLCKFLHFTPEDIATINEFSSQILPMIPVIVDRVYRKLFQYDITKNFFVLRNRRIRRTRQRSPLPIVGLRSDDLPARHAERLSETSVPPAPVDGRVPAVLVSDRPSTHEQGGRTVDQRGFRSHSSDVESRRTSDDGFHLAARVDRVEEEEGAALGDQQSVSHPGRSLPAALSPTASTAAASRAVEQNVAQTREMPL